MTQGEGCGSCSHNESPLGRWMPALPGSHRSPRRPVLPVTQRQCAQVPSPAPFPGLNGRLGATGSCLSLLIVTDVPQHQSLWLDLVHGIGELILECRDNMFLYGLSLRNSAPPATHLEPFRRPDEDGRRVCSVLEPEEVVILHQFWHLSIP